MQIFMCWNESSCDELDAVKISADHAKAAAEEFLNTRMIGFESSSEHDGIEICVRDQAGDLHRFTVEIEIVPSYRLKAGDE